ncbi:MAG: hypothetical protein ACREEM_03000 [Blastocatellia bacterium]
MSQGKMKRKTEFSKEPKSWRNWGDHPIIVTVTLIIGLAGTVMSIWQATGSQISSSQKGQTTHTSPSMRESMSEPNTKLDNSTPTATPILSIVLTPAPTKAPTPSLTSTLLPASPLATKSYLPSYTVRLLVPYDMSDAQVFANGEPATVTGRLPTFITISVKPQNTNTSIRLIGRRKCTSIEQLIGKDETISVNCQ